MRHLNHGFLPSLSAFLNRLPAIQARTIPHGKIRVNKYDLWFISHFIAGQPDAAPGISDGRRGTRLASKIVPDLYIPPE
jgi:hypothetical protein